MNTSASIYLANASRDTSGLFSAAEYARMREFFANRPELAPTPLRELPGLARTLGVGGLFAKDETARFGLNAFKLLGARFAVESLIREGAVTQGATLVCASEGNHGRAVARAARATGCAARVYLPHDAAPARVNAIASEGATVIKAPGSYDDAVRMLEADARANGWTIISDTAWPGYEHVPRLIMLGYTRMLDEIAGNREPGSGSRPFDAVFVQGGVGGLLCAVASWFAFHQRERAAKIISVEPTSAACLQASARAGAPVTVSGPLTTAMAGLRNREVSPLAFAAVLPVVDAYMAIDDEWSDAAARALARPVDHDPRIEAGASGAAAAGGLFALLRDDSLAAARESLGLSGNSRLLVIISEGVTDPERWRTKIQGS